MIIPAPELALDLAFIVGPAAAPVPFAIIGFDVDEKGAARPLCYPAPPPRAQVFVRRTAGWHPFDLANGAETGQSQTAPVWGGK